ncbi:MAG TPA: DinB family protein [Acidobacteriota bacterium]|jgi:uncharacterized damage-inducible protein DinB|nr:DinB family protein [Acidobacteriota bacterium]
MSAVAPQFQQYTKRMLDLLGSQDPMLVHSGTVKKLRKAIRNLSRNQLGRSPAPGKWSIRQIIAHLVDVEIVAAYRLRRILANPGASIEPFDQDVWAKRLGYEKHSVQNDLNHLEILKATNLELYRRLSPGEWKYHGMHVERGRETVEHICKMLAGHDLNHLAQVQAIRKQLLGK